MNFNLLYLLPLLALIIAISNPAFRPDSRSNYRSARSRNRHALRSVLARGSVIALLAATVVTYLWPMSALPAIAQGVLLTFLFMIPVLACRLGLGLFWAEPKSASENESATGAQIRTPGTKAVPDLAPIQREPTTEQVKPVRPVEPLDPLEPAQTETVSLKHSSAEAGHSTAAKKSKEFMEDLVVKSGRAATQANEESANTDNISPLDKLASQAVESLDRPKDQTEMQDEMGNVDDLVDYHELSTEESNYDLDEHSSQRSSTVETAIALAQEGFAKHRVDVVGRGQLTAPSRTELKQLISTLQSDKLKLQKLVIAQQAAVDSERQAHERTRTVAKDAIKIMRDARQGQRVAEKIARRERSQRQRAEQDYDKVRSALDNAMSTLRTESPVVDSYEL